MNTIMKSIEQKLKQDAQAFKKFPSESVHSTIMHGIENVQTTSQSLKILRNYRWLMPTGLATAALLVLMMNLIPMNNHPTSIGVSKPVTQIIKLPKINIATLSMSFESSLIGGIAAEKKAIQADLNYIKTMFTL